MTGDGGDELFAGYQRFRAALIEERIPDLLFNVVAKCTPLVKILSAKNGRRLVRLLAGRGIPQSIRLWSLFPLFSAGLWELSGETGALASDVLHGREALYENAAAETPLGRLLYCNFHDYLVNDLHVKVDRCTMAHGLEGRAPFMDTAVIEFAASLPDDLKMKGSITKYILRKTFADDLPAEIYSRGKKGFGVPLATWVSDLRVYLRDIFSTPNAYVYSYLDREAVHKLISEFLAGEELWTDAIWTLLTLEIWLRLESESRTNREYDLVSA